MRVKDVRIKGFRSLGDVAANLADYTSLIGKNDSGKSSFLRALHLLFDPTETLTESDICNIPRDDEECYIQATLSGFDGFDDLVTNGQIRIQRLYGPAGTRWEYEGGVPQSHTLKKMLEGTLTKGDYQADSELPETVRQIVDETLEELCPKGRVPHTTWRQAYDRLREANLIREQPGWCPLEPERLAFLVQVVVLQADVRAEEELTDAGKSVFSRVGAWLVHEAIKHDKGMEEAISKLEEEIERVSTRTEQGQWAVAELGTLETILSEEISRFDGEVRATPTLVPPKLGDFRFGVKLDFEDQWVKGLDKMGHGMRRSVVYAMLRAHRRLRESAETVEPNREGEKKPPLYLFLVEEPELYLHPQAEKHRMRELQELAALADAQVVLSTHSAFFVDLLQHQGIMRFERPNRRATIVHCWSGKDLSASEKDNLKKTYFFDPTRAAMLFADLVILVEGQTEKVTLPHLAERMKLNTNGVEVVDCGGNGNIPVYQSVLEQLNVRYVAWLDSKEKQEVERAKKVSTQRNGRIVLTDRNWEHMAKLPSGDKDKGFKSWKKYVLDQEEPNDAMKARIVAAYNWENYEG